MRERGARWVEVTDPEPGLMTTWLEEYRWDPSQIEVLSSREKDMGSYMGTYVTFRVTEPVTDNQGGTADYHDMEFLLSETDYLCKAVDSFTVQNADGSSYQVKTEIDFLSYKEESVASVMADGLAKSHFPY